MAEDDHRLQMAKSAKTSNTRAKMTYSLGNYSSLAFLMKTINKWNDFNWHCPPMVMQWHEVRPRYGVPSSPDWYKASTLLRPLTPPPLTLKARRHWNCRVASATTTNKKLGDYFLKHQLRSDSWCQRLTRRSIKDDAQKKGNMYQVDILLNHVGYNVLVDHNFTLQPDL